MRGSIICADTCWSVLDDELETISERKYDPFYLREEDKEMFLKEIKPYWEGRSTYEAWLKQIPEDCRDLEIRAGIYQPESGPWVGRDNSRIQTDHRRRNQSICDTIRSRKR